jgi:hypothetical protein
LCSKWEVGFDATDQALHIIGIQPRYEVLPTFGAGLSMQLVEALETHGIDHVALHPQLFVAIGLKGVDV